MILLLGTVDSAQVELTHHPHAKFAGTADECAFCTYGERFQQILVATDAAIQPHLHLVAHRIGNWLQRLDGRLRTVQAGGRRGC